MTKKDYELVARAIGNSKFYQCLGSSDTKKQAIVEHVNDAAQRLALEFASENPKFDKLKFLTACGMGATLKLSNGKELHDPYNLLDA